MYILNTKSRFSGILHLSESDESEFPSSFRATFAEGAATCSGSYAFLEAVAFGGPV